MNKRYIIGLYGQVGTGKSTVSQFFESNIFESKTFESHQWNYINQDLLGHQVINEYSDDLVLLFGDRIMEQGTINRKKLGDLVFNNPQELSKLVEFSHPIIIQKTNQLLAQNNNHTIIEGAFFYKVRESIPYTHLIYIEMSHDILYPRLLKRGHTSAWIDHVLASQEDIKNHKYLADFVLNNDGETSYLYSQIQDILSQLF